MDAGSSPPEPADAAVAICGTVEASFEPVVPSVMLVVDRSGSMNRSYGATSRWTAVYQTLMSEGSGLVSQLADAVRFGLVLYSGHDRDPEASCPLIDWVAPARANYDGIDEVYASMAPGEGTPTGAAMTYASSLLAEVREVGPRILVLATDGEPDTCATPSQDSSPEARAAVIEAVSAAHSADMDTYVIGVGTDVSSAHLQEVANAGRGLPSDSPDGVAFYRALDAAGLVDAFTAIINGARGCAFELDGWADPTDTVPQVVLDGTELSPSDWRLRDRYTLELVGAACDTILAGGEHTLSASFTCPYNGGID